MSVPPELAVPSVKSEELPLSVNIPLDVVLLGRVGYAQAVVTGGGSTEFSNALRVQLGQ